jgi:hypothetical protein
MKSPRKPSLADNVQMGTEMPVRACSGGANNQTNFAAQRGATVTKTWAGAADGRTVDGFAFQAHRVSESVEIGAFVPLSGWERIGHCSDLSAANYFT